MYVKSFLGFFLAESFSEEKIVGPHVAELYNHFPVEKNLWGRPIVAVEIVMYLFYHQNKRFRTRGERI